ncbi:hypothetical protein Lmor_0816 [Legionella moravica]|uniref:Uncharacterized protein n=1 Tax=Legionella moravica TaxID=39962 RepID=A0ABR5RE29_9GAMM|nr:hypothetical protein Lmor_0816 [Legionella moravica]
MLVQHHLQEIPDYVRNDFPEAIKTSHARSLGSVDNSSFDVPRLVRGIQFTLYRRNIFLFCAQSIDSANKSRKVGLNIMKCQQPESISRNIYS